MNSALKRLRISAGLTQKALADAAGCNIRQIQKFESGERDIGGASARLVLAIASALGTTVGELLREDANALHFD